MREIFVSKILEFPKKLCQLQNVAKKMFQRLLKIAKDSRKGSYNFQRLMNVAVWSSKSLCDLVSLLFRTQMWNLGLFTRLFWVGTEFSFPSQRTSSSELWVRRKKLSWMCVITVFDLQACAWLSYNACELAGEQLQNTQPIHLHLSVRFVERGK